MATMLQTTIRPMHGTDIDAVRAVLRVANAQFAELVPAPLYDAYLADVLDVESRIGRSTILVAEHDGRVVGTICLFRDANDEGMGPRVPVGTAGIRAVAVDPAARGLGIGGRLGAAAIEEARRGGAPAIILHTWAVMTAAMAVYERLGFRRAPGYDAASADFFPSGIEDDPAALAFWLDL
jgi:GNAT superfamily N-acetyltransferase